MEINHNNINLSTAKLLSAISAEKGEESFETGGEFEKLRKIMENVEDAEKMQADAKKEFDEKWNAISQQQKVINDLLKRPGTAITRSLDIH